MNNGLILTTIDSIPGYEIVEILGIARGSTVRTRNVAFDIFAGLKNIVGGEISEYTKLLADAREQAIKRMTEDAKRLGADAVVNVRFTTSTVMQGAAEILAYGTAVRILKF
ncbi:MAG: YbjQ family protein [Thermaurantimonas sp.]